MEKTRFYEQIEKYAVRIGMNDKEKTLCGSGILFIVPTRKEIYVLTVAHVIFPIKKEMETKGQVIYLTYKDNTGKLHNILIDNPKAICIHSKYKEYSDEENKQEFFYDSAIIQIPWESWMEKLNGYKLESGKNGITLGGYGFPVSLDGERKRSQADAFAGVKLFEGIIENRNTERFGVKYDVNISEDIPRDSIMEGYSGTGLFSFNEQGVYLRGMVCCSRGNESAGGSLWATDVEIILELMLENNIKMEYPDSFQEYGEMVVNEFPSFKKKCIRNWRESVDKILEDNTIIPKMFETQVNSNLPCESERKTCNDFWIGKLKELVIMHEVQQLSKEELIQPTVKIPKSYENEKVSLEFLCTELKAEYILGKLIEDRQFAKNGKYYNNMIILINGKKGHENCIVFYPRKDCRNIMGNIAGQYETFTSKDFYDVTEHLLDEGKNNVQFDIIKGSIEKCNIAAVGIEKLMEILHKENIEQMRKKMDNILEELWEE